MAIDQFKVSRDKDTLISNDPNDFSPEPEYILNLVLKIIGVSERSAALISSMPNFDLFE